MSEIDPTAGSEITRGPSRARPPRRLLRALGGMVMKMLICSSAWWCGQILVDGAEPGSGHHELALPHHSDEEIDLVVQGEFATGMAQLERYLADIEADH